MESKKTLELIIDSCSFGKEFSYFLTINKEGETEKV